MSIHKEKYIVLKCLIFICLITGCFNHTEISVDEEIQNPQSTIISLLLQLGDFPSNLQILEMSTRQESVVPSATNNFSEEIAKRHFYGRLKGLGDFTVIHVIERYGNYPVSIPVLQSRQKDDLDYFNLEIPPNISNNYYYLCSSSHQSFTTICNILVQYEDKNVFSDLLILIDNRASVEDINKLINVLLIPINERIINYLAAN